MKGKIGIIRRKIALLLIVALSINSFGAVVSDNDGSAFITKAEFDSLKNNFQSQIDNYNQSIDSKIDGAIAQYLAGITLSSEVKEYVTTIKNTLGDSFLFANFIPSGGVSSISGSVNVNAERHFSFTEWSNLEDEWKAWTYGTIGGTNWQLGLEWDIWPVGVWESNGARSLAKYSVNTVNTGTTAINPSTHNLDMGLSQATNHIAEVNAKGSNMSVTAVTTVNPSTDKDGWIYELAPSGQLILTQYCSSINPSLTINLQAHTFKDFCNGYKDKTAAEKTGTTFKSPWQSYWITEGARGDDTSLTLNIPQMSTWGSITDGSRISGYSETGTNYYYDAKLSLDSVPDGRNYRYIQYGKPSCFVSNIYVRTNDDTPTVGSQQTIDASETQTSYSGTSYTKKGPRVSDNALSGVKITYYLTSLVFDSKNLSNFFHETFTSIAGENVYLGEGMPFLYVPDEQNVKVKIKFKDLDTSGTVQTDTIQYDIASHKFDKGAAASGTLISSGTATAGTEQVIDLGTLASGLYWINFYAITSDQRFATIDTFELL